MRITIANPYAVPAGCRHAWLKGNLHAHSTRSDGSLTPQQVIDAYAGLGYQFLMFSDHDQLSNFQGLNPCGLTLLHGNEISARGVHILDVGARTVIVPDSDRQNVLDGIRKRSGFPIVCHPNWTDSFDHCSMETLLQLRGYTGVEIFNGSCVNESGSAYALEKWDRLLSTGRRAWGYANDDCHNARHVGLGWNVVRVPAGNINARSILRAIRHGNFYASSGATIESIKVHGSEIRVVARDAEAIEVIGEHGAQHAFVEGAKLRYDVRCRRTSYVRIQVYGHAGRKAWSQPLFVKFV